MLGHRHSRQSCSPLNAGARSVGLALLIAAALVLRADDEEKPAAEDNPYLARQGLSAAELQTHIERLRQAPASIRERPGFAQGIADAAERILAANPADEQRAFAVSARFESIHLLAVAGDADADARLAKMAAELQSDKHEAIAREARFYLLEQRVLAAETIEPAELTKLLDETIKTLAAEPALTARHLRIASATVKIINRLPDDEAAARMYREFGTLLAKSEDAELSQYGRQIQEGVKPASFVGKPLEIAGRTADGGRFDLTQYKGKVVLVDFWATWCGPCRAALPELVQTHQDFHERGFEVVGVSLDSDLQALEEFLAEHKLPWVNLIGEEGDDGLKQPLAEKYSIEAIPATFLVGADGRVLAENLSGDVLKKRLEKLLPADDKKTDQPAAEKKAE